jgi:hypothetical protein
MSDGREERKEQEERRSWQEPKDLDDELDRHWPSDEEYERLDSLAASGAMRIESRWNSLVGHVIGM